LLVFLRLSD